MVESQEVHLEASELTLQSPVESGFTVQLRRETGVTPPEVTGYLAAVAAATTVVPGSEAFPFVGNAWTQVLTGC